MLSKVKSRGVKKGLKAVVLRKLKKDQHEKTLENTSIDLLEETTTPSRQDILLLPAEEASGASLGQSINTFVGKYFKKNLDASDHASVLGGTHDKDRTRSQRNAMSEINDSILPVFDQVLGEQGGINEGGLVSLEPRLSSSSRLFRSGMDCPSVDKEALQQAVNRHGRKRNNTTPQGSISPDTPQSSLVLDMTATSASSLLEVMFLMQKTLQAILEALVKNNSQGKNHKAQLQQIAEELKQINNCMPTIVCPVVEMRNEELYVSLCTKEDDVTQIENPQQNRSQNALCW